ncbi:hypothetical protein A3A48_04385 [Candidatus Curtissbacteria bacterium RIFCSPLOWO2_01_FULL_37_9]|uniref:DUF5678 domain-containing protein n=1 Tax=Candidatus Curtissbacteria bacterium RIFCSPLOWO2_01_FULL_37_9 TaxID=1797724 RepID=A0A1F5GPW8_9BACT|nr:MAG: hypothetical protein A3A48_04385 [Candidatus Curtissbacteria bacterium RIFCSPLOWO2_01_FULL_37_9]
MKNNSKSRDKILNGITSGWVLVTKDNKRVLAHAKTLKQLIKNIELKGNPEGSISIVPPANFSSYVG